MQINGNADGSVSDATKAELVRRAHELVPLLTEKAAATAAARQLLPEVVDALRDAELLSLGAPSSVGGHPVDLDTFFEVAREFGAGCASTAWVWQIWTLHSWFNGLLPDEVQRELYANGPDAIFSSAVNPSGAVVKEVDGGYMLSGLWRFSSGVDYADWMMMGIELPGARTSAGAFVMLIVPKSEVEVIDDWYVMGLKGTGSKSVRIDTPVFVPEHRILNIFGSGGAGMWDSDDPRASYRIPVPIAIGFVQAGAFVGMARAVVDEFAREMAVKTDSLSAARKAENATIQLRIGEAAAEADAALHLARAGQRELLACGARGEGLTDEQRATFRLHQCYCVELARRSISRLYEISGTATMGIDSRMLRQFNDVYAGAKHYTHRWDEYAESYGRVLMGLPANAIQR